MECTHRNKNGGDIWSGGRLPFLRFAHHHAYTPRSTQRGVLIATLLRMDDNCTVGEDIPMAVVVIKHCAQARVAFTRRRVARSAEMEEEDVAAEMEEEDLQEYRSRLRRRATR